MPAMRNVHKCDGPASSSECDGSSSSFASSLNNNLFASLHPSSRIHPSRDSTSSATSTESNSQKERKNNKRMRPKITSLDRSERDQQQGKERVPRPRNAFIIFRSWYIGKVKAGVVMDGGKSDTEDDATVEKMTIAGSAHPSHSVNHQNELSKRAAKAWNGMNQTEVNTLEKKDDEAMRSSEEAQIQHCDIDAKLKVSIPLFLPFQCRGLTLNPPLGRTKVSRTRLRSGSWSAHVGLLR